MRSEDDRRQDIRDELLIEMARAVQYLIAQSTGYISSVSPMTTMGRIEANIDLLRRRGS